MVQGLSAIFIKINSSSRKHWTCHFSK